MNEPTNNEPMVCVSAGTLWFLGLAARFWLTANRANPNAAEVEESIGEATAALAKARGESQ